MGMDELDWNYKLVPTKHSNKALPVCTITTFAEIAGVHHGTPPGNAGTQLNTLCMI